MPEELNEEIEEFDFTSEDGNLRQIIFPSHGTTNNGESIMVKIKLPTGTYLMTFEGDVTTDQPCPQITVHPQPMQYNGLGMYPFSKEPDTAGGKYFTFAKQQTNVFEWDSLTSVNFQLLFRPSSLVFSLSDRFAVNITKIELVN